MQIQSTKQYQYGMLRRGPSPGAIPRVKTTEIIHTNKHETGFFAILVYDRPLSEEDIDDYELEDLNGKPTDYRKMLIELARKNKNIPRDPQIKSLIKDQKYQEAYNLALRFTGSFLELTLYRKGIHTKGVFTDGRRYYKSNETSGHNGPANRSTGEFELLTRATQALRSKHLIRIGTYLLDSNVGKVFEIEHLKPSKKLSLKQLILVERLVQILNAKGFRISDDIQVMLRGTTVVLTDFSNGFRGGGDDSEYVHKLFRTHGQADYLKHQATIRTIKEITGIEVDPQNIKKIVDKIESSGLNVNDLYFYEDELESIMSEF